MELNGIVGLIILILDIFVIYKIVQSRTDTLKKFLWILLVLILPLIGLIIWFLAGPGDKRFKL